MKAMTRRAVRLAKLASGGSFMSLPPDLISQKNALSSIVFGIVSAAGIILIAYRMLLE
jgi:hypothetical protein